MFVDPHQKPIELESPEAIDLENWFLRQAQLACGVGKRKLAQLPETALTRPESWPLAHGAIDEKSGKSVNKGIVLRDCDKVGDGIDLAAAQ